MHVRLLIPMALAVVAAALISPWAALANPDPQPSHTLASGAEVTGASTSPEMDAANHLLADGDYLLAQFFDGQQQFEYNLQVDADGEIHMPLVNGVEVAGLTPSEAADRLTEEYRVFYKNPYVTLQVLRYGEFEIFVFGPDFPGKIHRLKNGTRLLDVIQNPEIFHDMSTDDMGRYRRVHLIRGNFNFENLTKLALEPPLQTQTGAATLALPTPTAVARTDDSLASLTNWRNWIEARQKDSQVLVVDPLKMMVEGELSANNIALMRHDVIYIPTPERFVEIRGVANPGRYELLQEETLGEILRLAGSVSYHTDLINTVIRRFDEYGNLERLIFNLFPALDQPQLIADFKLQNRDIIKLVPREERIFVLGEVNAAGAFEFIEDSTVLDYIAEAGGNTPSAHMAWIAIIRQGRNRLEQLNQAEVIQVNFKEIHKGLPLCTDIALIPGDVIYLPPKGEVFNLPEILSAVSTAVTTFAVVDNAQSSN
ncbi:polysaccharide biosynthesis/export family protein [bacterium]|nr:polysaccharide biosynthesis/export family protein [bacterium]